MTQPGTEVCRDSQPSFRHSSNPYINTNERSKHGPYCSNTGYGELQQYRTLLDSITGLICTTQC